MRNCWRIFRSDWKSLGKNSISGVVVVGLVVIPSLYGWFCIYAFWDPYGRTENLSVAVACEDAGYKSSLVPVSVNIGKEVREELRENDQLNWVFVDREEAMEGVRSGEYYAALVIPEEFSKNLLSILSDDVRPAEILFYINEKENAIAAKVTSKGAGTVQKTIDEAVAEKASEIMLGFLDTAKDALNDQSMETLAAKLTVSLREIGGDLSAAADTLDALCAMNATLDGLLDSTDALLREIGKNTSVSLERLPSDVLSDANDRLSTLGGKISTAFQRADAAYTAIDSYAAQYLQSVDADAQEVGRAINTCADQIDTIIGRYQDLQQNVDDLAGALPDRLDVSRKLLNRFSVSLDRTIRQQTQARDALRDAAAELTGISSDTVRYRKDISVRVDSCRQALDALRSDYRQEVQPQIQTLTDALSKVEDSVGKVADGLRGAATEIQNVADASFGLFSRLDQSLTETRDLLRDAADKVDQLAGQMSAEDGTGEMLDNLLRSDAEVVSGYLSSVVKLETHTIYPVANFGSAMAPFYTSLAIWFGAIVLVAMLKVDISDRLAGTLKNPKNWQLYLGRYGVFLALSLFQCLLLSLGDLFYLGVSCAHPARFVLTCLYTGFVFVTIVYTLTASFGNIGKALAVILMVFQVAGSGGTIPIEMTPPFFHLFYPMLPLTHSMAAMRECVGGMFGGTLLTECGILFVYVAVCWLFGLVLRNPMLRLNHFFAEKVEETKVM